MSTQPTKEAELARIRALTDDKAPLIASEARFLLSIIDEQAAEIRRIKNEYQTIIEYGVQPWDKP